MINYNYRVFPINLTDGVTSQRVTFYGEKIIYNWGTSTLNIKLNSTSEDTIKLRPKQEIEAPFTSFFITANARDEIVELLLVNPAVISIGGGEVRVLTDQGYFNSIAQKAFTGSDTQVAAVGGYAYVELFNPPTSDRIVVLNQLQIISDCAILRNSQQIIALDIHSVTYNKYFCVGPNGQSTVERLSSAVMVIGTSRNSIYVQPNVVSYINLIDNNIIPPGCGYCLNTTVVNTYLRVVFHFREEAFTPE